MPPVRGVITKYIYHAYEGPEVERDGFITILMDDKVFQIEPHTPYEMTADSNGRILDHPDFYMYMLLQTYSGIYGLVQVETRRERTGIVMDLDKAEEEAQGKLKKNRWQHIESWVMQQLNERIKEGKPVLPPTGFVEESIKELNIDLPSRYKIQPVGWDWKPDPKRKILGSDPSSLGYVGDPASAPAVAAAETVALREENRLLNERLARLERLLTAKLGLDDEDEQVQEESPESQEEVSVGTVAPTRSSSSRRR